MQRRKWFELHDQAWFPASLRDLVTEALESVWNANRTYHPVVPVLRSALQRTRSSHIIDLCSGGGGPWLGLYGEIADGHPLQVSLTDLYPNARVLAWTAAHGNGVRAHAQPVDARSLPPDLRGFRTMFSSFHHFDPAAAHSMLADAFHRREGIAVFEAARRSTGTMLALVGVPMLSLRTAATAHPFGWKRFFWTCLVPVIPAILWIDGLLSCLRSYSEADLHELTRSLSAPDYEWQIGELQGSPVAIRYLLGIPLTRPGTQPSASRPSRDPKCRECS